MICCRSVICFFMMLPFGDCVRTTVFVLKPKFIFECNAVVFFDVLSCEVVEWGCSAHRRYRDVVYLAVCRCYVNKSIDKETCHDYEEKHDDTSHQIELFIKSVHNYQFKGCALRNSVVYR